MFNYRKQYLKAIAKAADVASVEQFCGECSKWFRVDDKLLRAALKTWASDPEGAHSFQHCKCASCGSDQYIEMPGKYDHPGAWNRDECAVQFWSWSSIGGR